MNDQAQMLNDEALPKGGEVLRGGEEAPRNEAQVKSVEEQTPRLEERARNREDRVLLGEYVGCRSEAAFAELVGQYLPLVYGTARRMIEDASAAEDVAQEVFLQLARKAWTVRAEALPGWLYRVTHGVALNHRRSEQRRRQRETEAMNLSEPNTNAAAAWAQLAPWLDEAMARLNAVEQNALVLRFLEGHSVSETGRRLGLSEAAAQKRVTRALEKLRAQFARVGVTASAALLGSTLESQAAEAPPAELAAKISGKALAGEAGATGIVYVLLQIFLMNTKTKMAVAAVVVVVVAILAALVLKRPAGRARMEAARVVTREAVVLNWRAETAELAPEKPMAAPVEAGMVVPAAVSVATADPQASLKTAMAEVLRLLQTKNYETLFRKYVPPAVVERLATANLPPEAREKMLDANGKILEEFYKRVGQDVKEDGGMAALFDEATKILEASKDKEPMLHNGEAYFQSEAAPGREPNTVAFVQEGGRWYLVTILNIDLVNREVSLGLALPSMGE